MNILNDPQIQELRQNARLLIRELGLLNDAYHNIGVTTAERHLLIEMNHMLFPTIGDIADRLLLDKSTASRLVAKAVKKGYAAYRIDETDKRKRYLQLTDKGQHTLHAFEPIAQQQTKEALLTLSPEEMQTVCEGIRLYAKGLNQMRIRKSLSVQELQISDLPVLCALVANPSRKTTEWSSLYTTYQQEGCHYLTLKQGAELLGGAGISPMEHPNQGPCQLDRIYFGQNGAPLLIDACIQKAQQMGYHSLRVDLTKVPNLPRELFLSAGFQNDIKSDKEILWKICKS